METMGSEVVEEGATGTMAGRRKPVAGREEEEEGSVRQDASRKNKGGTCIRFPTGDKRPRREVSRDGNTRENVDTRVSSRGPAVDRVA